MKLTARVIRSRLAASELIGGVVPAGVSTLTRIGGRETIGLSEDVHCRPVGIPSGVPPQHIKRYGCVVASASGVPFVPRNAWVANPRWEPCFCAHSLSECEEDPACH